MRDCLPTHPPRCRPLSSVRNRVACALAIAFAIAGCRTTGDATTPRVSGQNAAAAAVDAGSTTTTALSTPPTDWTRLIGQRVRIDAPLTVSGRDDRRRGEVIASVDGRLFTPTEIALPGDAASAVSRDNARRRLRIALADAGAPGGVPDWRVGSVLTGVEGDIASDDAGIVLRLAMLPRIAPAPRPAPSDVPGDLRLASFNLENFFNGDGRGGGFPTPRGARTQAELDAQLGKLVATIGALQPDVAALMELENDGDGAPSSIATLLAALNAATPPRALDAAGTPSTAPGDWRAIPSAGIAGSDQIRVGLIYRASRVAPVGRAASLADGPFGSKSRAPLAQAFRAGRGPVFVVVANHFKSKGCSEAEGADRDLRDGQACWNATRLDSARRLDAWLKTDPTRSRSRLTAIVGDFNAYAMEDPLRLLRDAGWRDALSASTTMPYSYVFQAQSGRLDHALLSPALAARLAGAAEWHSNADEDDAHGYRDATPRPAPATPWRSSDHDPLLVGFHLRTSAGAP